MVKIKHIFGVYISILTTPSLPKKITLKNSPFIGTALINRPNPIPLPSSLQIHHFFENFDIFEILVQNGGIG